MASAALYSARLLLGAGHAASAQAVLRDQQAHGRSLLRKGGRARPGREWALPQAQMFAKQVLQWSKAITMDTRMQSRRFVHMNLLPRPLLCAAYVDRRARSPCSSQSSQGQEL